MPRLARIAAPAIIRPQELAPLRPRRILRPSLVLPGLAGVRPTKNVVAQTLYFGPGSTTFTWPEFNQIQFDLYAAGGGGGGAVTQDGGGNSYYGGDGSAGGATYIDLNGYSLIAYGGNGGGANNYSGGTQGAHGGAVNGDTNIVAGGGAGGWGGYPQFLQGGYGGTGGRCIRTLLDGNAAAKLVGQTSTMVVGYGGAGGPNGVPGIYGYAGTGANGFAYIYIS